VPNPTAVFLLVLALLVIIVAYKGTQANFIAAILGHAPTGTGLALTPPTQPSNVAPVTPPSSSGTGAPGTGQFPTGAVH
jgi:hypothetical protein